MYTLKTSTRMSRDPGQNVDYDKRMSYIYVLQMHNIILLKGWGERICPKRFWKTVF